MWYITRCSGLNKFYADEEIRNDFEDFDLNTQIHSTILSLIK